MNANELYQAYLEKRASGTEAEAQAACRDLCLAIDSGAIPDWSDGDRRAFFAYSVLPYDHVSGRLI